MRSYILRIYRQAPQQLVGVLETVPEGSRRRFSGMDELAELLNSDEQNESDSSRQSGHAPHDRKRSDSD